MRNLLKKIMLLAFMLTMAAGVQAGYFEGLDAHRAGNYKQAVIEFRKDAEQGNAQAQYSLGYMYEQGIGVPKNNKKAIIWYRKAAKQDHSNALFALTLMQDDEVAPKDDK